MENKRIVIVSFRNGSKLTLAWDTERQFDCLTELKTIQPLFKKAGGGWVTILPLGKYYDQGYPYRTNSKISEQAKSLFDIEVTDLYVPCL